MSGVKGQNVGPRVIRDAGYEADVVDPARGEKVERCRVCGMPATEKNPLYPGLFVYIRLARPLNLCKRCIEDPKYQWDPRDADPMQLHDAA